MRILMMLTYYRPHTSGLTIYAERLARALSRRGHQVTVLTSQYERTFPLEEWQDGVRIVRAPVLFRISKGVIMPTIGRLATRLVKENDVVHLHLPQFDAAGVALRGRLFKKPTVITYHCDLKLPFGIFSWVVNRVVNLMNHLAAMSTDCIVTYTQDYADHSRYLSHYRSKLNCILPPVELPAATSQAIADFTRQHNPDSRQPVIGMAARFAAEKGVEVLLGALPEVFKVFPDCLVLYAGQYQHVVGEEAYLRRLLPQINKYEAEGRWKFLGNLDPSHIAAFYSNLQLLVVPSLNSTESFGLVQIEAMMNGVPVVAANLPGVRQPVRITGMGEVAEVGDSASLAGSILTILKNPDKYRGNPVEVAARFSPDTNAAAYEAVYQELLKRKG
jgi:glycosyltransferase involved in cell wall biosynthesis